MWGLRGVIFGIFVQKKQKQSRHSRVCQLIPDPTPRARTHARVPPPIRARSLPTSPSRLICTAPHSSAILYTAAQHSQHSHAPSRHHPATMTSDSRLLPGGSRSPLQQLHESAWVPPLTAPHPSSHASHASHDTRRRHPVVLLCSPLTSID